MTAKQYAEKYGERIKEAAFKDDYGPAKELLDAFFKEMETIGKQRHVKTHEKLVPIIKELNYKWNAMCKLITYEVDKNQPSVLVLKRDAVLNTYLDTFPEHKHLYERKVH